MFLSILLVDDVVLCANDLSCLLLVASGKLDVEAKEEVEELSSLWWWLLACAVRDRDKVNADGGGISYSSSNSSFTILMYYLFVVLLLLL